MVNVTNRSNVAMRLRPLKLFLGHGSRHLWLEEWIGSNSGPNSRKWPVFQVRKRNFCAVAKKKAAKANETSKQSNSKGFGGFLQGFINCGNRDAFPLG